MRKILFIQNPIAGRRHHLLNKKTVETLFQSDTSIDIITTAGPSDATSIVADRFDEYDVFVAVGGDGTVNEVGKNLVGTEKILGIVPAGSGNGLARELEMDMNTTNALKQIVKHNVTSIDTICINKNVCLNVAGAGFEAEVAHHFKTSKRRGPSSYAKSVVKLLSEYRPLEIEMEINGEILSRKAFSISFSNSRQFGNNAFISPLAGFNDGVIDVSVIKPFPIVLAPELTIRLFNKTLHRSWFYEVIKTEKISIKNIGEMRWHIDGEPVMITGPFEIAINKKSINVLKGN
jgi:diacylglycerol kinase (ATP)